MSVQPQPEQGTDLVERLEKMAADGRRDTWGLYREAANEITRLRLAAPVWRPIETAPKDGRFVLLHVPKGLESGTVTVGAYYKHDERAENGRFKKGNWDGWLGMDADVLSSWCEPTHWQPLPSPPTSQAAAVAGEERE